ncbi:uncharacterized protein CIMG_09439 [Coccidioides immitis RS]|uniref:Uncharacterized protein n=2 Tax=Coccidioides immitis TaxID=5501 RepID=J3K2D2_COCIM|nr:uncharacterized protein CIMG_09439 [Coccidioides immitis RS]EAS28235.3 hypothetical protein CIMG_09439 [Coccidioides immitis RS]
MPVVFPLGINLCNQLSLVSGTLPLLRPSFARLIGRSAPAFFFLKISLIYNKILSNLAIRRATMPIREKMKRVFSRTTSGSSNSNSPSSCPHPSKPKATTVVLAGVKTVKVKPRVGKDGNPIIELYKPHEVPRSKYRGPFDEEHLKRLAAYSIPAAMSDRPRSMVSELSPMGTWAPPSRRNSLASHEAAAKKMIEGLTQALENMEREHMTEQQIE